MLLSSRWPTRSVSDQRARQRDARAQVFPEADALWNIRSGRYKVAREEIQPT
jgi:hypothetical protein